MRKIFFVLLIILLLISFSGCVLIPIQGSLLKPYLIRTAEDLEKVKLNRESHYKQIADIDLSEYENWESIKSFSGRYDGNGFKITNLKINKKSDYTGLFTSISSSGEILNVVIENIDIKGNYYVGGIAGWNSGKIWNSKASGNINGNSSVGGIAGYNIGEIINSEVNGNIYGSFQVGGVVGYNHAKYWIGEKKDFFGVVKNCYSEVIVEGYENIGALIGENTGIAENNRANGKAIGKNYVGGLIGYALRNVTKNNMSNVEVKATGKNMGGLIGLTSASIENSYAIGDVTGSENVGGLVGKLISSRIVNSFSNNTVTGEKVLGGVIGYSSHGVIKNCYSVGAVKSFSDTDEKGAFFGIGFVIIENSYYDLEKSETSDEYAIGKSTLEMMKKETFVEWDFESIWDINERKSYPFLREVI